MAFGKCSAGPVVLMALHRAKNEGYAISSLLPILLRRIRPIISNFFAIYTSSRKVSDIHNVTKLPQTPVTMSMSCNIARTQASL